MAILVVFSLLRQGMANPFPFPLHYCDCYLVLSSSCQHFSISDDIWPKDVVSLYRVGVIPKVNLLQSYNKQQQNFYNNKILLIRNRSDYITFSPQIAYKLIEAGRSSHV